MSLRSLLSFAVSLLILFTVLSVIFVVSMAILLVARLVEQQTGSSVAMTLGARTEMLLALALAGAGVLGVLEWLRRRFGVLDFSRREA